MTQTFSIIILLLMTCGSANASLISRAGGLAYYDTVLNITWLADANRAKTSGYDADGLMSWSAAQTWIGTLNTASYLGVSDWRLPTVTDTGTSGCNFAFTGTDCGYNVNLSTGEMAHMFYSTLGNIGLFNTSGGVSGCSSSPPFCLTNSGPFSNLQPDYYWSGTEYAPATNDAWYFLFLFGYQINLEKSNGFYAWAVRPGDIGAVVDTDGDGVFDSDDNCALVANPTQLDSNADGYGNICDADINNSGTVTTADFGLLRSVLGQAAGFSDTAAAADMNGSGTVTTADFGLLRARLGTPPGPSGLLCAGTIPCPLPPL